MAWNTKALLQQRDPNGVDVYAENDAAITQALASAHAMVRSRVTVRYTEASFDALTVSTVPDDLLFHEASIALWMLAQKSGTLPDTTLSAYLAAESYLKECAAGKSHIDGLTLRSASGTGITSAGRVAYGSRSRAFDEDDNEEYEIHKPGSLQ